MRRYGPAQAGAVTGMMLGIGYSITGLAPLALGIVGDATSSFSAALWLVVGIEACLLVSTLGLTHERLHRRSLEGGPAIP